MRREVPLGAGTTRASRGTARSLFRASALLRRRWLDHHCRPFDEKSLPLQNSDALIPLTCHAATRAVHSDAFAMANKMLGAIAVSYTAA